MPGIYSFTDTWNAGGTTFNGIKLNVTDTASAAASLLMDLQIGGTSKASISKAGLVTLASGITFTGAQTVTTTTGALALTTGAANGNITLTPHGTGYTILNGNVGIGTTSPTSLLHLYGSSDIKQTIQSSGTGRDLYQYFVSADTSWSVGQSGAVNNNYMIARAQGLAGTGAYLNITTTGNVGIGTTAPDKSLEINSATGANLRLTYNYSSGSAANYADFSTSSGGNLTIAPSGGVTTISGVMQATRTTMNGAGAVSSIGMATDARTINDALVFGYVMQNSSSANVTYGSITTTITDPTAGSEDSTVKFNTIIAGTPTLAITLTGSNAAVAGNLTTAGVRIDSVQSLSGAGAVNVTTAITEVTTTGALQALTLANGAAGQEKTIIHGVDGGSFVLTPTTKTGWSTFTSTAAGESISLVYLTTRGWIVKGSYLGVIAP